MNNKKKILFGGSLQPNTFIGNVANLYPTKADLATVLSVAEGQISVFKIEGNDIQCYIGVDYDALSQDSFRYGCTYYNDEQGKVRNIGPIFRFNSDLNEASMINLETCSIGSFNGTRLSLVEFPNLLTAGTNTFSSNTGTLKYIILRNFTSAPNDFTFNGNNALEVCYLPECTVLGGDTTLNNNFSSNGANCVYYVNPYVMTCNGGSPNPDIQYLIDLGNSVRPVTDFTIPNNVTDLHTTNIYSDRVEIDWTAPASTNTIDWYAVYLNGNFHGRTVGNETNFVFDGLDVDTQFAVQVVTVDYFFNRSLLSNIATFTIPFTNAINDLATSYIGETYIDIDWTKPSNMYYDAERYDIYIDNVFNKSVQTLDNATISGLVNGSTVNVKVKAIDINGVESDFSNELNVLVNGVNLYPIDNIVAYYNFNKNVDDSAGANNGTATNITYEPTNIGYGAVFNGVDSNVLVPNSNDFNFTDGVNDIPFTISLPIKFQDLTDQWIVDKRDLNGAEWQLAYLAGNIELRLMSNSGAINIKSLLPFNPTLNTSYNLIIKSEGNIDGSGMGTYVDGVSQPNTIENNGYTGMTPTIANVTIGKRGFVDSAYLNGTEDGLSIMKGVAVNDAQALAMYNKQNNGQELI